MDSLLLFSTFFSLQFFFFLLLLVFTHPLSAFFFFLLSVAVVDFAILSSFLSRLCSKHRKEPKRQTRVHRQAKSCTLNYSEERRKKKKENTRFLFSCPPETASKFTASDSTVTQHRSQLTSLQGNILHARTHTYRSTAECRSCQATSCGCAVGRVRRRRDCRAAAPPTALVPPRGHAPSPSNTRSRPRPPSHRRRYRCESGAPTHQCRRRRRRRTGKSRRAAVVSCVVNLGASRAV